VFERLRRVHRGVRGGGAMPPLGGAGGWSPPRGGLGAAPLNFFFSGRHISRTTYFWDDILPGRHISGTT
jgi:hypothetical protein